MGRRLCRVLREQGAAVRAVDLPGSQARLAGLDVDFRPADIRDRAALADAMDGASSVIHLAAIVLAEGDARRFCEINVQGTANVIEGARNAGVRRFVHVSSISVEYPMGNAYSASKAAAEELVRSSFLDWTILRPSLAWGDASAAEHQAFVERVRRFPLLPLPGGGRSLKAPVHVDDLALAFARTLACPAATGLTLALAGPRTLSLARMAREIRASFGVRGVTVSVPNFLARPWAARLAPLLRKAGIDPVLDWQTWTGLVQDACPSIDEARRILDWDPRPWGADS